MNDEAINDAYKMFSQGGYNGSVDDFKQLISTNSNALNDSYNIFKSGGYNKDLASFKTLMGVGGSSSIKKKSPDGGSTSGSGLSEYQKNINKKQEGVQLAQSYKSLTGKTMGPAAENVVRPKSGGEYELKDNFFAGDNPELKKLSAELLNMKNATPTIVGGKPVARYTPSQIEKKQSEYNAALANKTNLEDDTKIKALNKEFGKTASLSAVYEEYDNFFKDQQAGAVKSFIEKTDPTKRDLLGNKTTFDLGLGNVDNNTKYRIKDNSWERLTPNSPSYEKIESAPSIKALNTRYGKDISTDVSTIVVKPKVIDPFLVINSNFLSKTEENALTSLEKKFGDDFIFEKTGLGTDYIKVTPKNGAESKTFSFDEKSSDEAIRLQSFLRTNASFEKGSSSAEKIIKKNIVTEKDNNYDNSSALQNNKYYESDEYKQLFKELSYFQKRDEIKRRQLENSVVEVSDMGWEGKLAQSIFGEDEAQIKAKKEAKILNEKLYNSEEFKLYDTEKSKFEKQQEGRYSLLLDEYEIKRQRGDKEGARQAKLKIESGFSKDVIGDNLTHLSNTQYDLMSETNNLIKNVEKLQERATNGLISEEEYNIGVEALTIEEARLKASAKEVSKTQKEMNALAGIYVAEKAKYGGFGSNLWNSFVVSIDEVREPLSYVAPLLGKDLIGSKAIEEGKKTKILTPKQKKYYEDKGYSEQEIKNVLINKAELSAIKANKKAVIEGGGFDLTTEESKSKLGFIENSLVGVTASLPSMLTRAIPVVGQGLAFASMANMSYNAIEEEMLNDPDFETTSKADRAVVAVPYAIVMGALENFALNRLSKGQAGLLGKAILSKVSRIIPPGSGRVAVENIINSEVKNIFAKGGLKVFRGTLAEFETGLYQAGLLDYGLKALYNELDPLKLKLTSEGGVTGGSLTGGELFDTPDTKAGVAMSILEGGVAEAIGGFAMSTAMVGMQGLINGNISLYDQDDLKFFEDFSSDEEFKKLIVSKLKDNMLEGTMTKGEAQAALNDIDLVAGIFNSIDENLPDDSKIEAFNLIKEKRILEKEVEGKDPALSKKSNDRIAEINQELEELPSRVQEDNLSDRGRNIEDALGRGKGTSKTIIIDGKRVDRAAAEAELQTIITKLEENAIQKQAASEVLVQPTTTVGEEVVQGDPTAESQILAEEGQKRKEITKALEDLDNKTFSEIFKLKEPNYTKALNEIEALNLPTEEYNKRVGKLNKQYEQEVSISIEEAYTKAKKDGSNPELVKAVEELLAPVTQELVSEEVAPQPENLTMREEMSLEAPVVEAPKVEAPVVDAPAGTAPVIETKEGAPTTFSWPKIKEYTSEVIRSMRQAQFAKLNLLLELKKPSPDQIIEIKALQAKIKSADAVLNARENKIKEDEKKAEKGEPTDKSPRVSGVDQNGKPAEFSIVVNEKKQTAKVQLKKRGDSELARQKVESDLKIQTDKRGRFVETQNKSRVYIDDKVTPPKAVELTAFGVPVSTKQEYSKENPKIIENENDAIEIEKINKDLYTEKISNLDIIKEGGKWVVRTQTEGRVEFTGKTLKEAKDYLANRNLETRVVGFKEAAPVTEVKVEAPVIEVKAEPVEAEMPKEIKEAIAEERLYLESMIEDGAVGFDKDLKLLNSNPYKYADEKNKKFSKKDKNGEFLFPESRNKYLDFYLTLRGRAEAKAPVVEVKSAPVTEVKVEAPVIEVKAEPVVEESETEKISRGAEMLKNMSEDERDNFIDDWREDRIPREALPGGARAITLYEAKKLVPNPTSKPKRVSIDNAFSLSMEHGFVINIDGVIYGLNKYEDPDATSDALDKYDEPKQYVWAYTNINEGGEVIETNESDIDELINEIKGSKESKAEPVVEAKAEPVKKPTETAEDAMGVINSIKEDIEATNNEIKELKAKARKAVNEIEAKILDTKNENQKEELQFDIVDIETQLEEDLEGLKEDLDRQVGMLKEEVESLKDLDIKKPENKKTLLSYIDGAIATLNGLNELTYAKLDAGVTLGTLKLILQGIRAGVVAGKGFNTAVRAMATKYKNEHKNEKITIAEFIKEINDYLDSTYVDPQTYKELLEKEIDKFAEIKEAVRQARAALKSQSKELRAKAATTIKTMLKGKVKDVSAVQMKSIMTRLASFNVFNQTQYDNFLEYVDKVIEITNYDTKVREANAKRRNAKNNTVGNNPKLGDLSLDLLGSLSRMLNINAKLISREVFDSYYDIVDDLSKRTTILSPGERADLNEKVNEIVDSIEQNEDMLPDLKDAYDNYADKVVENGVVNYAKTLTQMLEDGTINNKEFALMKKYKSKIVDAKVKVKMTPAEEAAEKAELINEITNTAITLDAIVGDEFRLERELVKRLAKLLNKESLENLDNKQLKDLIKIIENINDGFVSKSTQQMVEILNEKKNSSLLVTSIPKSVKGIFKKITQPIRGVFTRDKYGVNINPLFNIDEVFGDFKTKNIFNSVLNQSAVSQQQFQSEVAEIQGKLVKAESAIASSFNRFSRNENKIVLSKFKMMVYMMQLEFESNPNSQKGDKKQVNQAMKTLDATIKFAETNTETSRYTKEDIVQMKAIKKEFEKDDGFEEDGKTIKKIIDIDKLYNSFNNAEKNALKVFDEVNSLMTKKATYTATVINGNKIAPLKNYIYYNTISDSTMSNERIDGFMKNTDPNQKKGTESKNLEKRTGEVSPVSLDPFFAVNSSAKSVLVNYHMTEPIRTARKTLLTVRKKLEENKKNNENVGEQFEVLSVIEKAYDTATKDLLETNFSESSNIGAIAQYLSKAGYRAMLGSVTRASAELVSNAAFVTINNPKDMAAGFKYIRMANSGRGKNILTNLKSKVISRNYPAGGLSSNYVDLSAFTDRTVRNGKSRNRTINGVKQVYDFSAAKWVNLAEFTADFLIATPDKVVMKQLYFGAFSREFTKETGIEPDFEKIEANDEEYMDKYKDALEKATDKADNQTVTAGSSMNAYMGLLQNVVRKGDDGATALFKTFNQFMNRFTIQEYITARKGVKALVGRGDITWEEGVQVLAAVSARMTLYLTLGKVFSQALMYLGGVVFGYGDDDDDDEKTLLQTLYQSAVSSATTLFFGRNFGNVVRSIENYFIEQANKEYGEDIGLRNGEYDSFKDALQFNQLGKVDELSDFAAIMAGPLGPVINAGTLGIKLATKEAPKEDRAIETRRKEWYRLGIEAAGSVGLVPFYRDIRKVQMEWVYDELKTELKEDAAKKVIEDKKKATTLETKTNTLNKMRDIYKDEASRSIIDYELKKLSDPDFRKEENKKEEDEKTRLANKYGYESMGDFEYDDKEKYDKVFGDDSPYRKRMAPIAKIRQELDGRILADEFGKPYIPTGAKGAALYRTKGPRKLKSRVIAPKLEESSSSSSSYYKSRFKGD